MGGRGGSAGILAVLAIVALVASTPLFMLAQAETGTRGLPRHPASLASQSIITMNSTTVASYLVKLAEALSSNAHLVMARSMVTEATGTSTTLAEEAEDAAAKGLVASFASARWTGPDQAPQLLVSMPEGGSGIVYYLDSVGAEAFVLDVASAVYRGDYEAYLRASAAALEYYELLLKPSNAYTTPEGVTVEVPVIEALPSKECSREVNVTTTLLLAGGAEPIPEALLGILSDWRYVTYPLLGDYSRHCLWVKRTATALVPSTYLNSYVELLAYAMALIASLQPLGPDMNKFIVVQVANYTVPEAPSGGAEQAIEPLFNTSASPISAGGLRVIGDIERELLPRGIPGSFVAPPPGGGAGGNATLRLGGGHEGWVVGLGSLVEALRGVGGVGLPSLPHASGGPSPAVAGASRLLKAMALGAFLVLTAYLAYREGILRGLARAFHRLRLSILMRTSGIGVPKGLPEAVQFYLYALRVASRLARSKESWETPREYLNAVGSKLPFRARGVLERATSIYEKYRYSKKSPKG